MPDETPILSKAAYTRLAEELEELQTAGRKSIAERLQRARELGDLSENAEYHSTKDDQAMLEARIRKLAYLIRNAQIVEVPASADVAGAGTIVTLRPLEEPEGEPETYLLAASSEERASGVRTVTLASPMGRALAGTQPGDTVRYDAPGGTFSYEVLKLEPWDGA